MNDVFVLAAQRTPIGKFLGGLASLEAVDLGRRASEAAIAVAAERGGVEPASLAAAIELSIFGCARQAGTRPNLARQIAIGAGVPASSFGYTINMACGSGLQSVINGAQAVRTGECDVALVGGAESMSNVPHLLLGARNGYKLGHQTVEDAMIRDGFHCALCDMTMGRTTDLLAKELGLTREEADRFALESQHRCEAARKAGHFDAEIAPVTIKDRKGRETRIDRDQHPRDGVTLEQLGKLKPAFGENGTVTAGNASGINDGGAALLLASASFVKERGLSPIARLGAHSAAGVDPIRMGLAPVPATRKLLKKTGRALNDYDAVELNEAFAAQALACRTQLDLDPALMNVWGGAVALGHPVGCTGARICVTLIHQLLARGGGHGLATLCISGGLGLALAIECA
jgi:acetyl-CoA C-acetyltransferase